MNRFLLSQLTLSLQYLLENNQTQENDAGLSAVRLIPLIC